jgi:hypothetical protein
MALIYFSRLYKIRSRVLRLSRLKFKPFTIHKCFKLESQMIFYRFGYFEIDTSTFVLKIQFLNIFSMCLRDIIIYKKINGQPLVLENVSMHKNITYL